MVLIIPFRSEPCAAWQPVPGVASQLCCRGQVLETTKVVRYEVTVRELGYRPDERPYTGLSLTHGNAQAVTLGPSLHLGLRAVFSRRFPKAKLWDVCRRYGCTTFSMLGGMGTAIYAEPPRPDELDRQRVSEHGDTLISQRVDRFTQIDVQIRRPGQRFGQNERGQRIGEEAKGLQLCHVRRQGKAGQAISGEEKPRQTGQPRRQSDAVELIAAKFERLQMT